MAEPPSNSVSYRLEFVADDLLFAKAHVPTNISANFAGTYKLGEVWWNGNEWLFIRIDIDGNQVMDGFHYIPTDPDAEQVHRHEDHDIALKPEALRETLRAELDGRRKIRRDETLDMAKIGGRIEARKYWPDYLTQLQGRKGYSTGEDAELIRQAAEQERRQSGKTAGEIASDIITEHGLGNFTESRPRWPDG